MLEACIFHINLKSHVLGSTEDNCFFKTWRSPKISLANICTVAVYETYITQKSFGDAVSDLNHLTQQ